MPPPWIGLTKHTQITSPHQVCKICVKNFQTNHIQFKHTNSGKLFACEECESKFKHKKYLKAHMLHVHDSDEKKEEQAGAELCLAQHSLS